MKYSKSKSFTFRCEDYWHEFEKPEVVTYGKGFETRKIKQCPVYKSRDIRQVSNDQS